MERSSVVTDELQLLHSRLQFPLEVPGAGFNNPAMWAVSITRLITCKLICFTKGVVHRLSRVTERFSELRNAFSPLICAVHVHCAYSPAYGRVEDRGSEIICFFGGAIITPVLVIAPVFTHLMAPVFTHRH